MFKPNKKNKGVIKKIKDWDVPLFVILILSKKFNFTSFDRISKRS